MDISMKARKSGRAWLRDKDAEKSKASFPELFFDLVFVFGLIQLSHTLAEDFTSATAGEALLLILAIWWLWINTTWVTNLLNTDSEPVRLLLFALMFAGILLAIALPEAFGDHPLPFAVIYVGMQIGRSLFAWFAFRRHDPKSASTFLRITVWACAAGTLWIGGGLASFEWRLSIWSIALGLEYSAPLLRFRFPGLGGSEKETLHLNGEHLAERCALFVIICLGETILTTGRNAAEHMGTDLTFLVFCGAFLTTVAMWWIYFHQGQEEAAEKAEVTSKPEAVAHNLFTYGHLPIVAGIILTAVGEDFALSHPHEQADLRATAAIAGGPFLFLCGNIWLKLAAAERIPFSHAAGLVGLLAIAIATPLLPLYGMNIAATAALLATGAWEYAALRRPSAQSA
jgi:low temperature requirement protein LtrA